MSKFRIKMELQGLKLEIEGSREDASVMSQAIGQQIAGMMRPVGAIIDGESTFDSAPSPVATLPTTNPARRGRKKVNSSSQAAPSEAPKAIDFRHSPEQFGSPKQQWKTSQKAIWLLYVTGEVAQQNELSSRIISETFNKHFKQAGMVQTGNVGRDLGKLKASSPAPVGEDTTKTPPVWFLTEEGRRQAQNLVGEALGQT
ncbi:hypothetical protein FLL57_21445 [Rhodopseudomonas palustris]|uniref:hypothetical protein n=1 Tax=Rhodopseudomonas palustris TaxID=1076 RepID=UPI00115D797C|nr:hypothetical protein [Rhodopseudomonas palustris]QDL99717.1 hypothetical protein FLL57_21445 [Rhodopseudomonas palustris]